MRQLSQLYTANQNCYSVRYSPFDSSLLACVAANVVAGGEKERDVSSSLYIIKYEESAFLASKFSIIESFKFNAALFDVEWSPAEESLLATANGDDSIAIWRWPYETSSNDAEAEKSTKSVKSVAKSKKNLRKPIYCQLQHQKEVHSVQWEPSQMRSYHLVSSSADHTVKIWNFSNSSLTCLFSINAHDSPIHSTSWNPKMSGILLTTSADKTFRLWDINSSNLNATPLFTSKATKSDILCCDWSKFDSNLFALGFANGQVELRDYRRQSEPVKTIESAHKYGVRKIRFSPHISNLFGTISHDLSTKLWNSNVFEGEASDDVYDGLVDESKNHTEFAYGFDFDSKLPNRLADCGWDRRVMISEF